MLAGSEVDEAGEEESGEQVEQPILAPGLSCEQVQDGPGNDAEAKAVGDGVGERDEDEGEKRGNGDEGLVPVNLGNGSQHERAHQNERRRRSCRRDDADKRRGGDGSEEKQTGDNGSDARAAPAATPAVDST